MSPNDRVLGDSVGAAADGFATASDPAAQHLDADAATVGRARVLAMLADLWQQCVAGIGPGVVAAVVGGPGMGKSTLLDALVADVVDGGDPAVRLTGRGGSFRGPMSAVDELLGLLDAGRPPGAGNGSDHSNPNHSGTILDGEVDPIVAARRLGDALRAAGSDRPCLVVVDDLHDLDPTSRTAVHLALRSMTAPGTFVVLAGRPTDDVRAVAEGFRTIELDGLDADDARRLLDAASPAPIAPEVADRLLEVADGNPLALTHLPRILEPGHLDGTILLPEPIPVAGDLRDVFAPAVATLPVASRELLELAAVAGDASWVALTAAAGRPLDDELAHLEAEGLAHLVQGRLVPVHPLLHSAAIAAMSASRRRQLNLALAEVDTLEPEVRLLHRSHGVVTADDELVDDLVEAARTLRARGAPDAAARLLDQAVTHTADDERRRHLRIEAAEVLALAGATAAARTRLLEVRDEPGPLDLRTAASVRLARIDALHGDPVGAWHRLSECTTTAPPELRGAVHAAMSVPLGMLGLVRELRTQAAMAVSASTTGSVDWQVATVIEAHATVAVDEGAGRRTMEGILPDLDLEAAVDCDPQFGLHVGRALGIAELVDDAYPALATLTARSRGEGARASLSMTFGALGELQIRTSRYDDAVVSLDEAVSLGFATGQRAFAPFWFSLRARAHAVRGDHGAAADDLGRGLAIADELALVGARYFLASGAGLDAVTRGAHEEAVERLEECRMFEEIGGVLTPNLARWRAELIEAHLGLGNIEAAAAVLEPLQAAATIPDATRWTRATAERAVGLVTALEDPTAAAVHLEAAISTYDPVIDRFDLARTHLALAEVLQQTDDTAMSGRIDELRRAARYGFEVAGAPAWAKRCGPTRRPGRVGVTRLDTHSNGADAGEDPGTNGSGPADPTAPGTNGAGRRQRLVLVENPDDAIAAVEAADATRRLASLTPSELAVLVAVSEGRTNRQAATDLHVSPKTVANQLSRVYRKLGVVSRTEAARLYLTHR